MNRLLDIRIKILHPQTDPVESKLLQGFKRFRYYGTRVNFYTELAIRVG